MSISKAATERCLDASEITLLVSGLVLAFGAVGEYLQEHDRLPVWMKWSRKPKLVFVWMVALSLIGEFLGDAGVFVFSGHLQSISDTEVAALNIEAGLARKDAGDANKKAEDTAHGNIELGKQLEEERQKTARAQLDLERALTTTTQRLDSTVNLEYRFRSSLYQIPKARAKLWFAFAPNTNEVASFIHKLLGKERSGAGWDVELPAPIPDGFSNLGDGIEVLVSDKVRPSCEISGSSCFGLVRALSSLQLGVTTKIDPRVADGECPLVRRK